jgi:hypothetical protein
MATSTRGVLVWVSERPRPGAKVALKDYDADAGLSSVKGMGLAEENKKIGLVRSHFPEVFARNRAAGHGYPRSS